jgi:tape measure domain-containing protein
MAGLNFDAGLNDQDFVTSLKRAGTKMSEFSDKAVAEFEQIDKAVKKTGKGIDDLGSKSKKKQVLDFTPEERSLYGFNQKLQRTAQESGLTFTRVARESIGFSNTFQTQVGNAERAYARFASSARDQSQSVSSSFRDIATAAIGFSAAGALVQLPQQLIKVRGEFQNLEIAFETMLGSKSKADKLMADVVTLAATTPFGLKDAAGATKQLLAYGSSATEVIGELRMLGNVAAGVGAPIQDLTYLFGTLRAQGKAMTIDIRQFAGRGIPIYKELANVMGVGVDKVSELVEQGKVGFKEVQQAFENMTGEGGMFFNLMEKQSKSLSGLASQLGDAVDIMFNDMGRAQEGFLASALTGTIGIVQNYQKIIDILKVAAITYGTYRAAVMLAAAATRANLIITQTMAVQQTLAAAAGNTLSAAQARAAATSVLLQRAQAALNATMLANPYILAATALAGIVAYFAVYQREANEVVSAQQRIADSSKAIADEVANESGKVNGLVAEIKGLNGNRDKQSEKIRELISLNPELLAGINAENIATKDGIKIIDQYVQAKARQIEIQKLTQEAVESEQRVGDLNKNGADLGFFDYAAAGLLTAYGQADDATKKSFQLRDDLTKKAIDEEKDLQKTIYSKIEAIAAVDSEVRKSGQSEQAVVKKTVDYYDDLIEAKRKEREANSDNAALYKKYSAEIENLEAKRTAITGKLNSEQQKAAKEAEKRGPYGSVAYWEYISQKAKEILEKTPVTNLSKVKDRKQDVADAEKALEEARKKVAIKSFEDEIAEKKRLYELYNEWVTQYGKAAADDQFKTLKASGDNYVAYLDSQIQKLKSLADFTTLSDKDAERLLSLTGERDRVTGKESSMDKFQKSIDNAKNSASSLTETLTELRRIQESLGKPVTSEDYEKRNIVARELIQIERERVNNLTTFLQQAIGSEEQRLEITKHYADLRAAVEKGVMEGRVKDRKFALAEIDKAEQDELNSAKQRAVEQTREFKDLNLQSTLTGLNALKERVDKEKGYLNQLKINGLQYTEEYKAQVQKVKAATKDLTDYNKQKFAELADSIGSLGEAIGNLGGGNSGVAQMLGQLAQGVSKVNTALKQSKEASASGESNMQGYIQAATTAIQLVGMIIDSAKERKRAEEEFYQSALRYESELQLAMNRRIGMASIANENIFTTDYTGRIQDGVAQYADAQQKYLDAVERVAEEGKAKVSQKNKTDWGKVGSGAASGAAAGAAFGPWGAVIGGVVGAAVGFFGGKKKKDVFGPVAEQFEGLITVGTDGFSHLNKEMAESLLNSGLLDEKTKVLVQTALDYGEAMEQAKDQIKETLADLAGNLGDSLRDALVGAFKAGEDSALAFRNTVGKVIEDMIAKLLFSQIFDKIFDDLQKDMEKSADIVGGGDGIYTDDIIRAMEKAGPAVKEFNDAMQAAGDTAAQYGYDIFGNSNTPESPKSLTGAIATISQQSADELNAQFNSMRISQAQMLVVNTNQLFELQKIAVNTALLAPVLATLNSQQIYLKNLDAPLSRFGG